MATQNGVSLARRVDNIGSFQDTIALFQPADSSSPNPDPTSSSTTRVSTTLTTSATAGPTGWAYQGCYTDSVPARSLAAGTAVAGGAGAMTVQACTTACRAGNYIYAGVEYSTECCKSSFASQHMETVTNIYYRLWKCLAKWRRSRT